MERIINKINEKIEKSNISTFKEVHLNIYFLVYFNSINFHLLFVEGFRFYFRTNALYSLVEQDKK